MNKFPAPKSITPLARLIMHFAIGVLFFSPFMLYATHNLAGQIVCEQVDPTLNPNQYRIILTTYTDPEPAGVDRCSADIEIWSTGAVPTLIIKLEQIPRRNGPLMGTLPNDCTLDQGTVVHEGIVVKGTVKENIYDTIYTFPGPGDYELRYTDMYRHQSVENIDNPQNQTFYVETHLFISPPIVGNNNSPILLNRPLQDACSGKIWVHNPGGFDPDGDSLVYELRPSFQYEVPNEPDVTDNYRFPDHPDFGSDPATFDMDPLTGVITWSVPQNLGIYNFAFIVREYRDGALLGSVVRDMAVWVIDCDNNPPVIETISDTCIYAGDRLEFDYRAWDPDEIDSLYVSLNNGGIGNNGPFAVSNSATTDGQVIDFINGNFFFNDLPVSTVNNGVGNPVDTVLGQVVWQTECDNIRKQFYQVDLVATDNKNYSLPSVTDNTTLEAHAAITIRVVPPPPTDLTISKGVRVLELAWNATSCGDRVVGYNIYRKVAGSGFSQDTVCCESSPADQGFELIEFVTDWSNTMYNDSLTDIESILGQEICYVVTAMYQDQNNPDLPVLESCATEEICIEIEKDILYLTNDSVSVTDPVNGSIFLSWSQPEVSDILFPPPYSYKLYRANNNGFPAIAIKDGIAYNDTTYLDEDLDTETRGYNYRVEIFDALGLRVPTNEGTNLGSSIFLITTGGNNLVHLEWSEYVSWDNDYYEIFRSENGSPYSLLNVVPNMASNTHSYTDENLNPNSEYCYFIRSFGSHNEPGIKPELINDSQHSCAFARDEEPPCPPTVLAQGNCDSLSHSIVINKTEQNCADDTDFITVYFSENVAGPYEEVNSFQFEEFNMNGEYRFRRLFDGGTTYAGCYVVSATDTLGNTSEFSEPWCIDYCPRLEMANMFSPNGDGINEIFKPSVYQDIRLREFHVFDRWGRNIHTATANIEELWDGEITGSRKPAAPGVYYYYIRYEELGINGNTAFDQKGWLMLVR